MLVRLGLVVAAIVVFASAAAGAVKPNALFSDGAVLQQGIAAPVWGSAEEGEKVTVRFQGQTAWTTAKGGRWMVRLKPLKAGGPFTMTISGTNTIEIKNLLVGEVWVASGQSNMQWTLAQTENGEAAVAASGDSMLRLFSVPRAGADEPQTEVVGNWSESGPSTSGGFSGVAYFFGRDLRKALGAPVGLINTSYGGTPIQAWTSSATYAASPEFRSILEAGPTKPNRPSSPAVLYNAMIAPLVPYAIRGAIWYQGESNAGEAYKYRKLMPMMIANWRADWGQGDFPFFMVQLAPFMKIVSEPEESSWAELREAQLLTSQNLVNTGMAVITDCGNPDDIHPKRKEPVGGRLALAARAIAYGEPLVYQGPVYKSMEVKGSRAVVGFTSVGGGMEARGGELTGFTIAGEDRKFYNARATIRGDKVVVSSPEVAKPAAVRYGWANCPVVNLFNAEGLPATPFRTDDFPMVTGPK